MITEPSVPTTDEVRDIWVDYHLDPLPRREGIALAPTYQATFDRWLASRPVTVTPSRC